MQPLHLHSSSGGGGNGGREYDARYGLGNIDVLLHFITG
jgi:hypothetical protein